MDMGEYPTPIEDLAILYKAAWDASWALNNQAAVHDAYQRLVKQLERLEMFERDYRALDRRKLRQFQVTATTTVTDRTHSFHLQVGPQKTAADMLEERALSEQAAADCLLESLRERGILRPGEPAVVHWTWHVRRGDEWETWAW
jgi:hypothetical protein